jgi:hypothetical protein
VRSPCTGIDQWLSGRDDLVSALFQSMVGVGRPKWHEASALSQRIAINCFISGFSRVRLFNNILHFSHSF